MSVIDTTASGSEPAPSAGSGTAGDRAANATKGGWARALCMGLVMVLAMLAMSICVQVGEVVLNVPGGIGEHALALPAVWVFGVFAAAGGMYRLVRGTGLFSRGQLLCLFYALLLSAPLMSQGFWHRIVAITATIPRDTRQFDKIDALNDKLWPHGPNLLEGQLRENGPLLRTSGNVVWQAVEYRPGGKAMLPVLSNASADETSAVRLRVPRDGNYEPGEPFLISALLRGENLGARARYTIRLRAEGVNEFIEVVSISSAPKVTVIHPTGFQRLGAASIQIPAKAGQYVDIEYALTGAGRLCVADPKLVSVQALESLYAGRGVVTEEQYRTLTPGERQGVVVKPASMWSIAGAQYVLAAYVPWRAWWVPLLAWGALLAILLLGLLALSVLMRRQWAERERYQLPLAKIPLVLIGGTRGSSPLESMSKGWLWAGVALGLTWGIWHFIAIASPGGTLQDPAIRLDLKAYLGHPRYGTMFDGVSLEISIIFVALCLFMELNVLASVVIGYWLFRMQYWVGHANGWTANPLYPYRYEQTLGAYLGYALIVLVLSWRYLREIVVDAIRGRRHDGDLVGPRGGFLMLGAAGAAAGVWASSMVIGVMSMLLLYAMIIAVGFVATKLRAECGIVFSYFVPYNLAALAGMAGGIHFLGAAAVLFLVIASFFLANGGLFITAGAQFELLELARRDGIRRSAVAATLLLALLGGVFLGGWAFLSNGYATGGQQMRYRWAFDSKDWYLRSYDQQVIAASAQAQGAAPSANDRPWGAYAFAAGSTAGVTIARQLWAGFWFHPVGLILASSFYMEGLWGSALAAMLLRGACVWAGGATTVRSKLQPLAVGLFVGGVGAELIALLSRAMGYPPVMTT